MSESHLEEVLEEYAAATPRGDDLKILRALKEKYPQFADDLADFAAARAVLRRAPEEELSAEEERRFARRGLDNLRLVLGCRREEAGEEEPPRVSTAVVAASYTPPPAAAVAPAQGALPSLTEAAKKKGLSRPELAAALGLSTSLVMYLEKRRLIFSSIPQAVVARIARVLETGEDLVAQYLKRPPAHHAAEASFKARARAEGTPPKTFAEAVSEDQQLSAEEKRELLDAAK